MTRPHTRRASSASVSTFCGQGNPSDLRRAPPIASQLQSLTVLPKASDALQQRAGQTVKDGPGVHKPHCQSPRQSQGTRRVNPPAPPPRGVFPPPQPPRNARVVKLSLYRAIRKYLRVEFQIV